MTGSIKKRKTSSGKAYLYICLSYKDPESNKWKIKEVKTGLPAKGNQRKAEALIKEYIERYSYLETLSMIPEEIDPDIELCDFLDIWIEEKSATSEKTHMTRIKAVL